MTPQPSTILIVEDQDDLRDNLRRFLEIDGHTVLAAAEGESGYRLARTHRPDLILSDISMPGWDGKQLASALSQDPATAHIPVVFVSAWADPSQANIDLEVSPENFILKPFRLAQIREIILRKIPPSP